MSISTISLPSAQPFPHMESTRQPLTSTLLNHNPHLFSLATTHPFLRLSGLGLVPASTLSRWLSQDRLYAQSYVSFIGGLIARVHLPYAFVNDKDNSLRWKIVKVLNASLQNIFRELEFFESVAKRYGLELEKAWEAKDDKSGRGFEASGGTRQYESLFRAFGTDPTMTLLEGMVVLWATEQCYLSAWRYAANQERKQSGSQSPLKNGSGWGDQINRTMSTITSEPTDEDKRSKYASDLDGGALRKEFIPNWTSTDFEGFVQEIADATNELAEREEAWRKLDVYKAVWEHICEVERRFWPGV